MSEQNPTTNTPPLRVGIMGAAAIARKNVAAIQNQLSSCEIVAIASRSQTKVNSFCENHVLEDRIQNVEVIAGDNAYQLLIEKEDIDAIYVPLPVFVKKEWVIRALQAKKHVLCEKPVAITASEYQEMLTIAKENNRYIMDGTMFVHNSRTHLMLEYISQNDVLGDVTRISSEFTFAGDDNFHKKDIRARREGDPHGCIGDLGWYCIRLAQIVFKQSKADRATSVQTTNWKLNDEGVPIDATCLVFFDESGDKGSKDNRILSFHCSFLHSFHQRALIVGTKKSLELNDYVIPKKGVQSWVVNGQSLTVNDKYSVQSIDIKEAPSGPVQEVLMWRNFHIFCRSVEKSGWVDADALNISNTSMNNQKVLDALMESINLGGTVVTL